MTSRTDARFSTYSGAPSLHPSLAPTFSTQATTNCASHPTAHQPNMSENPSHHNHHHHQSHPQRSPYGHTDPNAHLSTSTLSSTDPKTQDLKSWSSAFARMQDARLDKQRYEMSGNKSEEVSKIALGAKVERALARRMTGQDAQFTPKKRLDREKRGLEVEAN
ncbi:hypothetical protein B0A50_01512 [Salinomyces thailandicus]|uniref:Uncharacterized protein n=1 Tax=Salinomyces thailandicus TaxID=706561 RepID=A0A4U0UD21_9PEZI|nr:hypothetical protein B0A50_01512 [Salinomyces thailandica]